MENVTDKYRTRLLITVPYITHCELYKIYRHKNTINVEEFHEKIFFVSLNYIVPCYYPLLLLI